jgi:16S rRNA processing protein RimM
LVFRSAVLGSPVGLKGFIKIRSFSGEYGHLAVLKTMRLELPSGGSKELSVEAFRAAGTGSAVKFAGFDTPEAVKKFSGAEVLLERSQAAPLGPGEYYI